jgi:hypothetical protein
MERAHSIDLLADVLNKAATVQSPYFLAEEARYEAGERGGEAEAGFRIAFRSFVDDVMRIRRDAVQEGYLFTEGPDERYVYANNDVKELQKVA